MKIKKPLTVRASLLGLTHQSLKMAAIREIVDLCEDEWTIAGTIDGRDFTLPYPPTVVLDILRASLEPAPKRVKFESPIKATDKVKLEVQTEPGKGGDDAGKWAALSDAPRIVRTTPGNPVGFAAAPKMEEWNTDAVSGPPTAKGGWSPPTEPLATKRALLRDKNAAALYGKLERIVSPPGRRMKSDERARTKETLMIARSYALEGRIDIVQKWIDYLERST